jgi:hypothetical protein
MFKRGLAKNSPWRTYQQREWLIVFVWLGYIPVVLAVGYPISRLTGSEIPFLVVALSWMLIFAIAGVALSYFKCPACNKPFFNKWWFHNQFARKCVHCGFPKWAEVKHD